MKRPIAIVVLGLGLAASGPALAWESIDNPDRNGQCAFMQAFDTPGQTTFVVSQDQKEFDDDDSVRVIVYNKNWSLQAGQNLDYPVSVTSNDVNINVEGPAAVDNGLALTVSHEHLATFAGANPRLVIIRKGDQAIARLDFAGFASAWSHFEGCRRDKVAARNERRQGLDEVPLNPFANGP
jgi:hypothetical protein